MASSVSRLRSHSENFNKFQKGDYTLEDYVRCGMSRDHAKYEKTERALKIAARKMDGYKKFAADLKLFTGVGNEITFGDNANDFSVVKSSDPASVEYIGGNDAVASLLTIDVAQVARTPRLVIPLGDGVGPGQQRTQLQINELLQSLAITPNNVLDAAAFAPAQQVWNAPNLPDGGCSVNDLVESINRTCPLPLKAAVFNEVNPHTGVVSWSLVIVPNDLSENQRLSVRKATAGGGVTYDGADWAQRASQARYSYQLNGAAGWSDAITQTSNTVTIGGARFMLRRPTVDAAVPHRNAVTFRREASADKTVAEILRFVDNFNGVLKSANDSVSEKPDSRARLPFDLHSQNASRKERKEREEMEERVSRGAFAKEREPKKFLTDVYFTCKGANLELYGLKLEDKNGFASKLVITDEKKLAAALKDGLPGVNGRGVVTAAEVRRQLVGVAARPAAPNAFRGGVFTQLLKLGSGAAEAFDGRFLAVSRDYDMLAYHQNVERERLTGKEGRLAKKYNASKVLAAKIERQLVYAARNRSVLLGQNDRDGGF
ncbi:hypothetical protein FACS1894198_4760 [Clostridia bacterium]|nr:hypothetical protein FACS1894198_4760 [Clostridia bacterium]